MENTVLALKVNRGGALDPKEIIGRDRELQTLLRRLESESVNMAAERRIGKTSICALIVAHPPKGILPIYVNLQDVKSGQQLVEEIREAIEKHLSLGKRMVDFGSHLRKGAQDSEFKAFGNGVKLGKSEEKLWKKELNALIADLIKKQTSGRRRYTRIVLLLDEFPVMVANILHTSEMDARDVLDVFRELRSEFKKELRMVLTGSIGIHHVLRRLDKGGNPNRPTNDVPVYPIGPLREADAKTLALALLHGEEIPCDDLDRAAASIAAEASNVPFYIHHIVGALRDDNETATPEAIKRIVEGQIKSPQDPWRFRDYDSRLDGYFGEEAPLVRVVLDAIATSDIPLDLDALVNRVILNPKTSDANRDKVLDIATLLEQDFYIESDDTGSYNFCRPLLQRAWIHIRRLKKGASHV